jgi:hypothetical protein
MLADIRNRGWRHYADLRRTLSRAGSAKPALDALGVSERSDGEAWTRATDVGHTDYREAIEPLDDDVAIVCVSNRPDRLTDVIANVQRQRHDRLELVYVDNSGSADLAAVSSAFESAPWHVRKCTFLSRSPEISLGHCLNAAFQRTDARFVAKFDDDDYYGVDYVTDALRAHRYAGAGVVGKHTYYGHLLETDEYVLRFPGHEFSYSSTLAGGTLVIDRDRVGDQRFRDISIGEDRAFIVDCHRRGISTFSADRFGFLQARGNDNTWATDRQSYLAKSRVVPPEEATARLFGEESSGPTS